MNFNILYDQHSELFNVSNLLYESSIGQRVYRYCPIFVNHKITMTDLVQIDMVDINVIIIIGQIHVCYALVDCTNRVLKFKFTNQSIIEWKISYAMLESRFILYLKERK